MSADLKKLLWLAGPPVIGALLFMWRDLAVLQSKVQSLERVADYYHGEFKPPQEAH